MLSIAFFRGGCGANMKSICKCLRFDSSTAVLLVEMSSLHSGLVVLP